MSDIKLFHIKGGITELPGESIQVEKSLQSLFELNLEHLLGIRFLASEYSTGPVHGGRIDTLGIDEDGSPVIIEYKRAINENVVSQGLYYLDWLLDHRKDFQWLVMEKLGADAAKSVEWAVPRLLCIAGDFTRYDEHAVKQIARNIELMRYRRFGSDLLMIELVHAPKQARLATSQTPRSASNNAGTDHPVEKIERTARDVPASDDKYRSQRLAYRISQSDTATRDIFEAVRQFITSLGDDVQVKELSLYVAFKRIKNFACLEIYPQAKVITVYLKLSPNNVTLEEGFTRDVTNIGHFGTGDLQVSIRSMADFSKAQSLFMRSYEGS